MHRSGGAILVVLSVIVAAAACAPADPTPDPDVQARRDARGEQTVRIVHPEWSSEIASAHLFAAVLRERLGYRVALEAVAVEEMWERVAQGEADAMVGAWLPVTHAEYQADYGQELEDLGPNLEGARIGLVVPASTPGFITDEAGRTGRELVTVREIGELATHADRFRGRVVGIESGAGVVQRAREALERYDLARRFRLVESDEERMLEELRSAVRAGRWIVMTGWTPHWAFERYDLRFLDDPQSVFGGEERIHTMVRPGLADDLPDAYRVLDRISYRPTDLERIMWWIVQDDRRDPYAQAIRWIETNRNAVDEWVEGVE